MPEEWNWGLRGGEGKEQDGPSVQKNRKGRERKKRKRIREDDGDAGVDGTDRHECVFSVCDVCKITLVCGICNALLPAIGLRIPHLPRRCQELTAQFRGMLAERDRLMREQRPDRYKWT